MAIIGISIPERNISSNYILGNTTPPISAARNADRIIITVTSREHPYAIYDYVEYDVATERIVQISEKINPYGYIISRGINDGLMVTQIALRDLDRQIIERTKNIPATHAGFASIWLNLQKKAEYEKQQWIKVSTALKDLFETTTF